MRRISFEGEIWADKNKEYSQALLELLAAKDCLIVLSHGKPPFNVILGAPHQTAIGEQYICERKERRDSDENVASYALVTFSALKEHEIPCKLVIMAHSTMSDPNKDIASPYFDEIFKDPSDVLIECHGAGMSRKLDLELSAGQNTLSNTIGFGELLASALQERGTLGVQKQAGTDNALIFQQDGKKSDGRLENPATKTVSLIKAEEKKIPALHLEARPQFRKANDGKNRVTGEGVTLGRALAQAIIRRWMNKQLKKVEQIYTTQIYEMTGSYNRETERMKEYHGRQLLELLQNADDEAEQAQDPSMLIRLEGNRLIVANNGTPFSRQGVLSLMYSDNSPKVKRRNKIGYKGLGFRAVLNWSHSIWIKSGLLSIEFSRANAVSFLKQLLEKNIGLEQEIEEASKEKYPIATLAVPTWKGASSLGTLEYDTYIILDFSSDEVRDDIQRQISALGMEVALFLNNLKSIKLESLERSETIMRITPQDGKNDNEEVRLLDQDGRIIQSRKWRIFSRNGELPSTLRETDGVKQYEYDLRIAVSEELDDKINRLFCYFKTEVKFPFPAVIHGTFDLDGNRNHLNLNRINEFLLQQLAELMIDSALELAKVNQQVNWDAIRLLARRGEFDDRVEKMGFYNKLVSSMKTHKLIPVLPNEYMSPQEGPVFYEVPFANILKIKPKEFHDLALYINDNDIQALLRELGINKYGPEDFVRKLGKISEHLSLEERAELILMIAANHAQYFNGIPPDNMPALFTDEEGKIISSRTQALLPPERSKFRLPENIRIVFISAALSILLKSKADAKTGRALADELACFKIQEYRFDTVIRRVVTVTNRLVRKNPGKSQEYIKNMVSSLFLIFKDESDSEKEFPEAINVQLFTRSGALRNARELYFGSEYTVGKIMDSLYSEIDETVFLSKKEDIGLEAEDENAAIEFLKWVGVEEYPRIKQKTLEKDEYDQEYEDYVLRNLKYPYQTNYGETYTSYKDLKADRTYRSQISIGNITELDNILNKSRFEYILAWLHLDQKLQTILREGHELPGSSFGIWFPKKIHPRHLIRKEIRSYILYKLEKTEWITTRSGRKVAADICCLSKTLADMSPLIEVPAYNIKDEIFKTLNIKDEDAEYVLVKIGASHDFGSLPDETIYAVLANLERLDPEGKKARTIYRQIIDSKPRDWARMVVNTKPRNEFVEHGKLLAKTESGLGYFPVIDVYYVDNITFCKEIVEKFPIVQIDRRSGKDQVREIFGAKPLEDIRFSITSTPETHPLNSKFAGAFEKFKPYILVFRLQKPSLKTELNQLKRLRIIICNKVSATYVYGDKEQALQINAYEHIIVGDDNTAYLQMPLNKQYKDLSDLKADTIFCDSIAEIVTEILKVGEKREAYRELFSKDALQRELIIHSDLDDPQLEKLRQANQLFRSLSDVEMEFWQTIVEMKGGQFLAEHMGDKHIIALIAKELHLREEFLAPIYQEIYYERYSSPSNMSHFKILFEALDISVEQFNHQSAEPIDFTDYLTSEITKEKYRLLNKFKSNLFQTFKDKPLEVKETFTDMVKAYEDASILKDYNINKELFLDEAKYFDTLFQNEPFKSLELKHSDLLQQEDLELDENYRENLNALQKRIGNTGNFYSEDIQGFLDNSKNRGLLFFGEYEELLNRFNKKYTRPSTPIEEGKGKAVQKLIKKISLNGKEQEYEEDSYGSIMGNIEDDLKNTGYEIFSHDPSKPPEQPEQSTKKSRGRGKRGAPIKHTKEIGFVGEYYVYRTLIKKYSEKKVFWVSEYAKVANFNPNGNDAEGYDIRYLDEKDQVHYAEVKASNDEDTSFPISVPEVRFGEEQKSNYEVIIVQNVLTIKRKIINLGKIFEYNEEESFNNNSKFIVENDGFRIKFQI